VILRLHENAHAPELMALMDQVAAVMSHLASCTGPPLDEHRFLAAAPGASWLLRGRRRGHIDTLLSHTSRAERAALAAAIEHDRHFDLQCNSRSFRLRYPGLPEHVREHAQPLLVAFYDVLSKGGLRIPGPDASTVVVNLRRVEAGFFEANHGIRTCPGCLEAEIAQAGDGAQMTIDCDHTLPKSIYGQLAVHPQNLVFMCTPCNGRRKGRADPLADARLNRDEQIARRTGAGALRKSYLPYQRPALREMKIEFTRAGVTLTGATNIARERIANLDRVLGVTRTWSDVLPRAEREMFEELQELRRRATTQSVKDVLTGIERRGRGAPEQLRHGVFLRSRYAAHLKEQHLDALVEEWRRKADELKVSAALHHKSA
jgi:hypothetical protein